MNNNDFVPYKTIISISYNSYLGNVNRIDRARNFNPGKNRCSRKITRRDFIDGCKERNAFKTNRRGKLKPF